jgi:hypothetical protein
MPTSSSPAAHAAPVRPHAAAKAFGAGVALVAAALAAVWASGVLAADDLRLAAVGTGTAVLASAIVALVQPRLLRRVDPARLPGMQLQIALGLQFVVKLACLALGVLALVAAGTKFSGVAAFAVSFAAASLVLQVCNAALSARSLARVTADPARSESLH